MTTLLDHGAAKVQRLRCPLRASHLYPSLVLALRDLRTANERNPVTGVGAGNDSWIALSLGMVVLDTLSGQARDVSKRWTRLLTASGISDRDAKVIYRLRCSVLHGYGLPRRSPSLGLERMVLTGDTGAYALDARGTEWLLSVPTFCSRLVERVAWETHDQWDQALIDTDAELA